MKPVTIKIAIHKTCSAIVEERIKRIRTIIKETQAAANNETKSSAGDKHETGRAMAQLETEKLSKQLVEAIKTEQVLAKINPEQQHQKIGLGSLVITNYGNFYISISLGKVEISDEIYFAISSESPIGKSLIGLRKEKQFSFNEKKYVIEELV